MNNDNVHLNWRHPHKCALHRHSANIPSNAKQIFNLVKVMRELLNFKFLMFNRVMFAQGLTIACITRSEEKIFE